MTRDTVYYNQVFGNQLTKSYLNNKFKTFKMSVHYNSRYKSYVFT